MKNLNNPGYGELYRDLCLILSGRMDQTDLLNSSGQTWSQLFRKAKAHGIAPLIYKQLKSAHLLAKIPERIARQFAEEYYNTAANNELIYGELERILDAFKCAGIEVVVLKGAALARNLYPDISLRPMGDVDLLIRNEHVQLASQIVEKMGFVLDPMLAGVPANVREKIHYEVNFNGGLHIPIHLELHWGMIAPPGNPLHPQMDWFWTNLEQQNFGGQDYLCIEPTAHLAYLAAHLILKHWNTSELRLLWLWDLHLLVSKYQTQIRWDELWVYTQEFHWRDALLVALSCLVDLFNTTLPNQAQAWLLDMPSDFEPASQSVSRWANTQADFSLLDWQARLRLTLALIFPHPDYVRHRYQPNPQFLWPLYYPYRWIDMLKEGVSLLAGRKREDVNKS